MVNETDEREWWELSIPKDITKSKAKVSEPYIKNWCKTD